MLMHRFESSGLLALRPQALLMMHPVADLPDEPETIDQVAIVQIRGPLVHHKPKAAKPDAAVWDSYESIAERVTAACAGPARAVVLKIDSTGGEVYGCFDTARAIRAKCAAAGKRLYAYVEGDACSAGYALACAASKIVVSETAFVGSIGIMETRFDASAANAAGGVRVDIITSGARKADRHADVPVTEEEIESAQERVNSLATVFFELVASMRPKLTAQVVRALDANVFHGSMAVKAGLADEVGTFDSLLAAASAGETMTVQASAEDIDTARAALERAAEGEGEEAEKARAALKALNGEGEDPPAEEEASSEDDDDDEPSKEAATTSPAPAASSTPSADPAIAALTARLEKLENKSDAGKKAALFASRPDLPKETIAALKTTPFAQAKAIVHSIPKPAPTSGKRPAAAASATATRGNSATVDDTVEDDDVTERSPEDHRPWSKKEIDARMGLGASSNPIKLKGNVGEFGIMTPAQAAARVKARAEKGNA